MAGCKCPSPLLESLATLTVPIVNRKNVRYVAKAIDDIVRTVA